MTNLRWWVHASFKKISCKTEIDPNDQMCGFNLSKSQLVDALYLNEDYCIYILGFLLCQKMNHQSCTLLMDPKEAPLTLVNRLKTSENNMELQKWVCKVVIFCREMRDVFACAMTFRLPGSGWEWSLPYPPVDQIFDPDRKNSKIVVSSLPTMSSWQGLC